MTDHFDCELAESLFSRAFDGRLSAAEKIAFTAHVESCARCESEYERYDQVFSLVRGMPSFTTDRPAPLPAGAGSFRAASRPSLIVRAARVAGAAALILGVGFVAYQFGRETRVEAPPRATPVAERPVETTPDLRDVRLPARKAGGYLRRLVRGTKDLGLLVESAGTAPEAEAEGAVRLIDNVVARSPLGDDARRLRELDEASLRSYTPHIRSFAREVEELVERSRTDLARSESAALRMARLREAYRSRTLREHVKSLEDLADIYEMPPMPSFAEGGNGATGPLDDLAGGVRLLICGEREAARLHFERVMMNGDPTQRRVSMAFAIGRGFNVGSPSGDFELVLPHEGGFWIDTPAIRSRVVDGAFIIEVLKQGSSSIRLAPVDPPTPAIPEAPAPPRRGRL
ncbi:MAG: zf-HC2 domain-containing protein [Planctomycetota bacterium]